MFELPASRPAAPQSRLVHYTDGQALIGIVEREELWATGISYLNDSEEWILAYRYAEELLLGDRLPRERNRNPALFAAMFSHLDSTIRGSRPGVYIVSFSENEDDLSQWRGYTSPGNGYSLHFSTSVLNDVAEGASWRLRPCWYGHEGREAVLALIRSAVRAYEQRADPGEKAENSIARSFAETIQQLAPLVKADAFKAEREWRLVSPLIDVFSTQVYFRAGRSSLVPYLKLRLGRPLEGLIQLLTAGPGPSMQLAGDSLMALVVRNGNFCGITRSSAPYRPW